MTGLTLLNAISKDLLGQQRVLLVTSSLGAKRRSCAYVQHVLRTQFNCLVQLAVVNEPSIEACADAMALSKRTQSSVVVGLGGSTVLDAAKFIGYGISSEIPIVMIPCVPAGGKEFSAVSELFDWQNEERIVVSGARTRVHTVTHPHIFGLEDKVDARTDCRAFTASLSIFFNQSDSQLLSSAVNNNRQFIQSISEAMNVLLKTTGSGNKSFTEKDREVLFRPDSFVPDSSIADEFSLDVVIANLIAAKVAIPRSLLRCALLYPCAHKRCLESLPFGTFLQQVTSSSTNEQALSKLAKLLKLTDIPQSGLFGLMATFLDQKATEVFSEHVMEWIEEASTLPQYSHVDLTVENAANFFSRSW